MVEERFIEKTGYGTELYYVLCEKCGKKLAEIYRAGAAYQFYATGECEHYRWEEVGNGCMLMPENEICKPVLPLIRKAIKIYQQGTSVYLLIPQY